MPYQLDISPAAQAEIKRSPGNVRQRILRALKDFAINPRPHKARHLILFYPKLSHVVCDLSTGELCMQWLNQK